MKPLPRSSGDLIADRRYDYAEMLFADGESAAAAELMLGALELAPGWALGWFRLGDYLEAAGDLPGAERAWRTVLRLEPDDRPGAGLKLHLIGAEAVPNAPPSPFVEALFDEYAPTFDEKLVGALGYRVPRLLEEAIVRAASGRRFRLALDLGCGTGLMGERLRPLVDRLEGYDLSAEMLRKARAKGIYDLLEQADLQEFRREAAPADLVTAADVFMYVGALDRVVATAARLLESGGLFAFSVEGAAGSADFALQASRRYAHSRGYVERLLGDTAFALVSLEEATIRQDRGEPVAGLIVVARRD
ncbi:MAG: methyltransferase domain-containing protein [Rhizobiaceae bacterium]|nr:methyltransferase domain-containing protein [Rhizobiaceae bacterium]